MKINHFFREKISIVLVVSLCLGMGACEKEEQVFATSDTPIIFSAESNWIQVRSSSRSTDDKFPVGTKVGVFAYYMPSGTSSVANIVPNYMINVPITKGEQGWSYSPLMYWPGNPGDKIHFVAYHPMSSAVDEMTISGKEKGYPTISYKLKTGKTDLLASLPISSEKTKNPVDLQLKHILGQVNCKIQFENVDNLLEGEMLTVNKVVFKNIHTTGSFKYDMNDNQQFQWANLGGNGDFTVTSGTTISKTANEGAIMKGFPIYVLPGTISVLDLHITTTVNGTTIDEIFTCHLNSSVVVGKNTIITFKIKRGMTGFVMTAVWENADENSDIVYDNNEIIVGKK